MNAGPDDLYLTPAEGGVTAPAGFVASGVAAGLKSDGALDVALVVATAGPVPPWARTARPSRRQTAAWSGHDTKTRVSRARAASICMASP